MPRLPLALTLAALLASPALAQSPPRRPEDTLRRGDAEAEAPKDEGSRGPWGHVHTSREKARLLPLPKERDVWHFVIFGDRTGGPRSGLKILRQAVDDTNLLDPDLVMTVGDLIQGYCGPEQWEKEAEEFKGIVGDLKMPWYPVAGNHDVYWRGEGRKPGEHDARFEKTFGPLWYWFPHKDAAFIVLYSDEGDPETGLKGYHDPKQTQMSKDQLAWLDEALEKAREYRHAFVFIHHPRWLTELYEGSNWDEVHARLVKAGNVRAVFGGHIHQVLYAGKRDGIDYMTLGATGAVLVRPVTPRAGYLHHYNVVTVREDGVSHTTIPVGAVIDPKTIDIARYRDVDALFTQSPPEASAPLVIAASAEAPREGVYKCLLKNPAKQAIELNLMIQADGREWRVSPDHAHLRLAAGAEEVLTLRTERLKGWDEVYGIPEMAIQVDVLAKDCRIKLPERRLPLATVVGAPDASLSAKGVDRHLCLEGGEDAVSVSSADIGPLDGPFTLEGWVRAESYAGRRPLLAKTNRAGYGIFASDGKLVALLHDGRRYVAAEAEDDMPTGRWVHVAMVFDGAELRLYRDGRCLARAEAKVKLSDSALPLIIGADPNGEGQPVDGLTGHIDEVRLSQVARYTADFEPQRRLETDGETRLMLRFDRDLGPLLYDHSGRGAHGRRVGNAACRGDAR